MKPLTSLPLVPISPNSIDVARQVANENIESRMMLTRLDVKAPNKPRLSKGRAVTGYTKMFANLKEVVKDIPAANAANPISCEADRDTCAGSTSRIGERKSKGCEPDSDQAPDSTSKSARVLTEAAHVTGDCGSPLIALFDDTPWHVVLLDNALNSKIAVVSSVCAEPLPDRVPPSAEAVVVIANLACAEISKEFVKYIVENNKDCPPIIVVLKCNQQAEHLRLSADRLAELQRALIHNGASHMLIRRRFAEDLVVDTFLAVEQTQIMAEKARVHSERLIYEHDICKFWPCAHRFFQGLPKVSSVCNVTPQEGATIGPVQLIRHIGTGTYGKVFMVQNMLTGHAEAMKVVSKCKLTKLRQVLNLANELKLKGRLHHQHVVELYQVGHAQHFIFLLMEYVGNTNLYRYLKYHQQHLDGMQISELFHQIVSGIAYCHREGIAHRDLKPENVGVMDEAGSVTLKIVDFGSHADTSNTATGIVGTMPFMPPEVLIHPTYNPVPTDLWACGVILVELLCGIDQLQAFMNWPSSPEPSEKNGVELQRAFDHPDNLLAWLGKQASFQAQRKRPSYICRALCGLMDIFPDKRWSAAFVESLFTSELVQSEAVE